MCIRCEEVLCDVGRGSNGILKKLVLAFSRQRTDYVFLVSTTTTS